jgi:5'-nucleotidase
MKRIKLSLSIMLIVTLFMSLTMGVMAFGESNELEVNGTNTLISIVHVNDIHSRVTEGSGMGYAKIATIVEELRLKNQHTLFLDAGDTFHGQTFATLQQGESIIKILNAMGLDAIVAGNHDFNYGIERLLE